MEDSKFTNKFINNKFNSAKLNLDRSHSQSKDLKTLSQEVIIQFFFDKKKMKLSSVFDHEGSKNFLRSKLIALKEMNLTDEILDFSLYSPDKDISLNDNENQDFKYDTSPKKVKNRKKSNYLTSNLNEKKTDKSNSDVNLICINNNFHEKNKLKGKQKSEIFNKKIRSDKNIKKVDINITQIPDKRKKKKSKIFTKNYIGSTKNLMLSNEIQKYIQSSNNENKSDDKNTKRNKSSGIKKKMSFIKEVKENSNISSSFLEILDDL